MKTYHCSGFRPFRAEGMSLAAEVFAKRAARRSYGRKGYVYILRENSYSTDLSLTEFDAFIGYKTGLSETTGHNIKLVVQRGDR